MTGIEKAKNVAISELACFLFTPRKSNKTLPNKHEVKRRPLEGTKDPKKHLVVLCGLSSIALRLQQQVAAGASIQK